MKKTTVPLVIGNWKMNPQTVAAATRLAVDIKKRLSRMREGVDVVVAPPTAFLGAVAAVQNSKRVYRLGAQNVHWERLGPHTGETSLSMVQSFGATHIIVGHSERRAEGLTNEMANKKVHTVIKGGATAVLCVGEGKRDNAAHYLNFIEEEIRTACAGLSKAKLESLVIAYEPIWAIGTGSTATPDDVHEMRLFIEKVLTDIYGRNFAGKVRILYGGSVNEKNAAQLLSEGMVDGFLVGGASLHAGEFCEIVKITRAHAGLS